MTGDATQGDVVEELDALVVRVIGAELAVFLTPCGHCGQAAPPAFVQLASMFQEIVKHKGHELSLELAGIAARERARRAKRQ